MTLLHEMFDASVRRYAHREALRHRGESYSYTDIQQRTQALAGALARAGIGRGERVVIYLQNRPEAVEIALACSRIGALFVPANPMLKGRQLGYLMRDCGARMLVASFAAAVHVSELSTECPQLRTIVFCDAPDGACKNAAAVAEARFEDLLQSSASAAPSAAIDEDPAALLYTSGSTGRPKGVVISHRNLVSGALSVSQYLGNHAEDRILAVLPLSFDYGFSQVTTAFCVGACAVLSNFALPAALLQEIAAERISGLAGVPTMWMHLASVEWPAAATQALRYITNSGGALTTAVLKNLQARLPGTQVFCMYGLTEAFRSTYLEPAQLASRPGSIGKAIPNQEVLVVHPDGTPCRAGEVGELVHRGSLVTLGYWNDPEATRQRFRPLRRRLQEIAREDVAVWSGDLAKTDEEGYLYFVGRGDHMIKSSGHRISPTEIEEVVAEVGGVVETVAIGLADETLGQRIAVAVVPSAAAPQDLLNAIRQHCRMQLPLYMVPAEIHLLPTLPRNVNGKFDRSALASLLQARDASEAGIAHARAAS